MFNICDAKAYNVVQKTGSFGTTSTDQGKLSDQRGGELDRHLSVRAPPPSVWFYCYMQSGIGCTPLSVPKRASGSCRPAPRPDIQKN